MAGMQRLLGTMLASRMAGRGGMGGALGSAAMMGLGGPLLRSKAGLAVLGYLAYRSYRGSGGATGAGVDVPPAGAEAGAPGQASARGSTIGGTIGGIIDSLTGERSRSGAAGTGAAGTGDGGSLADRIIGALSGQGAEPAPEETISDAKALLLIRAMIAAVHSDGGITAEERARICERIEESGADPDERRLIERELDAPMPLDALLRDVKDRETAQQFYLASRAALEGATPTQQSYLSYLRQRLDLPAEDVETVEKITAG